MRVIANSGAVVACVDQPSDACPNRSHSLDTETFTDAHGETLSIRSSDVTCPVGPHAPSQFRGIGQWIVTGGTGRYRRRTGHGRYSGLADIGRDFRVTFTGTIS